MGVYHLMGLGLSPGAVTTPLSYLANRYKRWNVEDQEFFSRSGEVSQREKGEKVGDTQSLVLFTTSEVIQGTDGHKPFLSFSYIDNQPSTAQGVKKDGDVMKSLLPALLKNCCREIFGKRKSVTLFWCQIDRRDIQSTYERIIWIITVLSSVGGQGKEMWINLTGGNNVTNFALQLAAALSGAVARLYYIQAQNQNAEKCIRFTTEEGYWIELPVMPLDLSGLNLAVLDLIQQFHLIGEQHLYSHLCGQYWNLIQSQETFREIALKPMWKQGLIVGDANGYSIGSQWKLIQPYRELMQQIRTEVQQKEISLEKLAQQTNWIKQQEIKLI